jgi:uncharacterized protein YfiM (DUF2279 family)
MNERPPSWWWLAPLIGVGLVLLVLVAPIGLGSTAFSRALENAAHAPLFALIAVALLIWLRHLNWPPASVRQYLLALAGAVALGGFGEIAQSFTASRHAEWIDLVNDLLGAAAGLSLYALYDKRLVLNAVLRRALLFVVVVALLAVAAPVARLSFMYWQRWQQLPALATWESQAGHHFVISDSAELKVIATPLCANASAALQVSPLGTSRWVGATIDEPWPDWSSYSQLAIEVANPNDKPLDVVLRINDGAHTNEFDDRFNRSFAVAPHARATLQVPLSEVQAAPKTRQLDLKNVTRLVLFQDAERDAQTMYVCGVRLIR